MTTEGPAGQISIWALLGARAGDNDQVVALAEAIGLPFQTRQLEYNGLRHLGPRLLGASLMSLTSSARRTLLEEPLPDVTISAGHRSVAVVRGLRHRSRGRMRSIHVGFPRVSPAHFDLVIATPQYPIPDHPKLLRVPYALTRAATEAGESPAAAELKALPHPRQLLVVGGPTLFWALDGSLILSVLSEMMEEAAHRGGSVVVTTSPRTPHWIRDEIARALGSSELPLLLAAPGKPPRYPSLLRAADTIRVTADSVAMVSDAIWTGKPIALVPIVKSALGRVAMSVMDRLRLTLYPRDLRRFWHAIGTLGVTDRLAIPISSKSDQMRNILERVRPIVEGRK